MFPKASYALAAAVLIAAAPPTEAERRAVGRPAHYPPAPADVETFAFAPAAAEQLSAVWSESIRAQEERVA